MASSSSSSSSSSLFGGSSSQQELVMSKFDMSNISFKPNESKGPVIVLLGKRDTGKSVLVKDLLYHHQRIPMVTVIAGTELSNPFYGRIVPRICIHHEYNTMIIEKALMRQLKCVKQIQKEEEQMKRRSAMDPRHIVILDDCLYDQSWTRDKLIRLLFMNGRHWKIMLVITMQYPLGIPPMLRSNIDYVFILRNANVRDRKIMYENYCGMFPSFEAFCDILDKTTEDFECLVVQNNVQSNKLVDLIRWYKAEMHTDFKLCAKELWDQSAELAARDDELLPYDVTTHRKRSAGPPVKVKKV